MSPGDRNAVRALAIFLVGFSLLTWGFVAGWELHGVSAPVRAPLRASTTYPPFSPLPAGSCRYRAAGARPDPSCTPGALNSAVTTATLSQTICLRGWTATIRPPAYITGREKVGSMASYASAGTSRDYEYDHLISLELGGAPNDVRNLWPEPHQALSGFFNYGSFVKDKVENALKRAICDGRVSLRRAQRIAAGNWTLGFTYAGVAMPALP